MDLSFQHLLSEDFDEKSRVWIYQSSRLFSLSESLQIEERINEFIASWQSHGAPVKGYGNLLFGQFLVLMADETGTTVGGCSTDSSVRFVKELEHRFGVDFFNRTQLAFVVKEKVQLLPMNQLNYAFENGFLDAETLYFNNLVQTKEELENKWIVPVKNSWIAARFPLLMHGT